jgi:hypothetical protein
MLQLIHNIIEGILSLRENVNYINIEFNKTMMRLLLMSAQVLKTDHNH